jgi:hypothetical protein
MDMHKTLLGYGLRPNPTYRNPAQRGYCMCAALGGAGEMENVSQVFQPSGR